MDKGWFDNELQNDSLPKGDILKAIKNGIADGKKVKRRQTLKTRMKWTGWASGIAASVVLASGFLFTPINSVLADVPVIGKIYDRYQFSLGKDLAEDNLVNEINQKATSNGVDVTITSAFYDGNVIGVTFKAEGDDLSLERIDKEHSPEPGYALGGSDKEQFGGTRYGLEKVKDGSYVGAMEFELRAGETLPKDYTLPIEFIIMANKKGSWKFEVPVTQLPTKTIKLNASGATADGKHRVQFESLTLAKATSNLVLTTTDPTDKDYSLNIKVLDDHGDRISLRRETIVHDENKGDSNDKQIEVQMEKISDKTDYLIIYPELFITNKDRIKMAPIKVELRK